MSVIGLQLQRRGVVMCGVMWSGVVRCVVLWCVVVCCAVVLWCVVLWCVVVWCGFTPVSDQNLLKPEVKWEFF